jgi:hypothetical protein
MNAAIPLPIIPVIDVREGGPVRHALEGRVRARALRDDCLAWFPGPAARMLPVLDGVARRWLRRSRSPYVAEIESIAGGLGFPGIWFLNGSYQWGCTTLAREEDGVPWLARTLDWPFPGLGRHAEVAHLRGPAGDFFSVTWPGYVGALTVMAPGRFGAAVNQAPLLRRTSHPYLRPIDLAANAIGTWRLRHIPPDQLLRETFETCVTFADARRHLETIPIARPVIYTLVGCEPGERCVIERTEEEFATSVDETCAANDWLPRRTGWEGRISATKIFKCTYEEAAEASGARREALSGWREDLARPDFLWVTPPVLNPYTRLAVAMCPAKGLLRVAGYELAGGAALPQPVTKVREIARELAAV